MIEPDIFGLGSHRITHIATSTTIQGGVVVVEGIEGSGDEWWYL